MDLDGLIQFHVHQHYHEQQYCEDYRQNAVDFQIADKG